MQSAAVLSKPLIRPFRDSDVVELAMNMREEDSSEVFHSSRSSPLTAVRISVEVSDVLFTIERYSKVVAIFGVSGTLGTGGSPWMLGTDELKNCRSLLRECRLILDRFTKEYGFLANAVWSQNTVHIEWLKWLGFSFHGSTLRNGETFLNFYKEFKNV